MSVFALLKHHLRFGRLECSYNYTVTPHEPPETAHIIDGPVMRVRWVRYDHEFPARRFLEGYPDDFGQFLQRCQEMANFGRIKLWNNGHQLNDPYNTLHQFNLKATRSWGYKDGRTYIVLSAAKKRTTGQEPDYDRAIKILRNYLEGRNND